MEEKDYIDFVYEIESDCNQLSQDIISQLLEAGPQQSAAIHALNMLSDRELEAYGEGWREFYDNLRNEIAVKGE